MSVLLSPLFPHQVAPIDLLLVLTSVIMQQHLILGKYEIYLNSELHTRLRACPHSPEKRQKYRLFCRLFVQPIACEYSRLSSLPTPRGVRSRNALRGPGAMRGGCIRRLYNRGVYNQLEHGHTHSANQCPVFVCSISHKLS